MARDEGNPGSADGGKDDGWNADGSLPKDLEIKTPADSVSAIPMKGESEEPEQPEPEEGQEPEPEEGAEEAQEGKEQEPEKEEPEEDSETKRSLTELQGKFSQMEKMLQFYQNSYNQLATQMKTGGAVQPPTGEQAAQGKPTPQGQAQTEQLDAPPPEWKTSEEVVQYFDKRNQAIVRKEIDQVVKQYVGQIDESFGRVNQAIHTFIDRSIKPQLKDFDDVIKDVNNELFVLDPTGQNIVGFRNQALLQYFKSQPIPILAMYDYGVSKKAPQKIKEAAQQATKKTVQKIAQKPKAPKQIKGGASSEEAGELDWNTPRDKVEQILGKKRLI